MTFPVDLQITTAMLYLGTCICAVLDLFLVFLLVWQLKPEFFRRLRGEVLIITAIFWCGLWFWAIAAFWEKVYQYVFPGWSRWLLPLFQAGLATLATWLSWLLSSRFERLPVLVFLFCGGLWGALTHLWAVNRGIVDKPPMLQGAAPAAAVTIAIFEFIFYWCIIVSAAALTGKTREWIRHRRAARLENEIA